MDLLREEIREFLKLSRHQPAAELRRIESRHEEGYWRSLITYVAPDGEQIEAFLFEPEGQQLAAAVLALHQHNSQWEIGKSEIAGLVGDPHQAFGPALARRGVTVLAPDAIGFESRMSAAGWGTFLAPRLDKPYSTAEGWLQYYNQATHRLVRGDLLMRKMLEDCATALTVLRPLPTKPHLGVVGHSFGGNVALFLAALDTRIAFACSSGAVCSYRHKFAAGTGLEAALIIPGFAARYDLEGLLRCVAPRNILVVSSEEDPLSADAEAVVTSALPEFEAHGCSNRLEHLRTPGPHALDGVRFEAIVDWVLKQALTT